MNQNERRRWLIHALLDEMPQYQYPVFPYTADRQWRLLRSLMNVRPPMPVSEEFLQIQDDFLKEMTEEKGIVDADSLPPCAGDPRLVLWQGDITTLRCDAIVNAANSQMLGCFSPCHGCIDNIIHTMSVFLRNMCCTRSDRSSMMRSPRKPKHCWHPATVPVWNWQSSMICIPLLFAASPPVFSASRRTSRQRLPSGP